MVSIVASPGSRTRGRPWTAVASRAHGNVAGVEQIALAVEVEGDAMTMPSGPSSAQSMPTGTPSRAHW